MFHNILKKRFLFWNIGIVSESINALVINKLSNKIEHFG